MDVDKEISWLDQVPIVKKFINVFLEELPGLTLYREIDLVSGTEPISMAP